jgi:protein-tyrosine phosphatase
MIKVLFVCMGNICRSPTAHGVFESLVNSEGMARHVEIDSAGTHAYHVGESPDRRASQTATQRGYDLSYIRARSVEMSDFDYFDYILAMDEDNYSILASMAPSQHRDKVQLFLEYASARDEIEVPDPYYGGAKGFEHVLDLVEEASKGLLDKIKNTK